MSDLFNIFFQIGVSVSLAVVIFGVLPSLFLIKKILR